MRHSTCPRDGASSVEYLRITSWRSNPDFLIQLATESQSMFRNLTLCSAFDELSIYAADSRGHGGISRSDLGADYQHAFVYLWGQAVLRHGAYRDLRADVGLFGGKQLPGPFPIYKRYAALGSRRFRLRTRRRRSGQDITTPMG